MSDRTTVRLPAELLRLAKRKAAEEERTLTSLIEEGLRLVLAQSRAKSRKRVVLPVSKSTGGTFPGIDINDNSALLDLMERDLPVDKLR
jgi:hypothetical protein